MLVVTRKRDEKIVIGRDVVVTVLEIRGDKARIGISAPPHVAVMRSELLQTWGRVERPDGHWIVGPNGAEIGPFASAAEADARVGSMDQAA
jgi:carbon storage regulator